MGGQPAGGDRRAAGTGGGGDCETVASGNSKSESRNPNEIQNPNFKIRISNFVNDNRESNELTRMKRVDSLTMPGSGIRSA
jgi:hypothetical protein